MHFGKLFSVYTHVYDDVGYISLISFLRTTRSAARARKGQNVKRAARWHSLVPCVAYRECMQQERGRIECTGGGCIACPWRYNLPLPLTLGCAGGVDSVVVMVKHQTTYNRFKSWLGTDLNRRSQRLDRCGGRFTSVPTDLHRSWL